MPESHDDDMPDTPEAGFGYEVRVVESDFVFEDPIIAKMFGRNVLLVPLVDGLCISSGRIGETRNTQLKIFSPAGQRIVKKVLESWRLVEPSLYGTPDILQEYKNKILKSIFSRGDGEKKRSIGLGDIASFPLFPNFYEAIPGEVLTLVFPMSEAFFLMNSIIEETNCNVAGISENPHLLLFYPRAIPMKKAG